MMTMDDWHFFAKTFRAFIIVRMSREVSERWKRRVGKHHWALEEDEFVRYSPAADKNELNNELNKDTVEVIETPLLPPSDASTSVWNVRNRGTIFVAVMVVFISWIHWRRHRIPPAGNVSLGANKKKSEKSNKTTSKESKEKSSCYQVGNGVSTKRIHEENGETAPLLVVDNKTEKRYSESSRDKMNRQLTRSVLQMENVSIENQTLEQDAQVTESTDMAPFLVPDEPRLMIVGTTADTHLDPRQLVTFNDTTENTTDMTSSVLVPFNGTTLSSSQLVATAQDAHDVAQAIRVTKTVFENHGLPETLATEWAMRRQESELSESARQRHEEQIMYMEAAQRHEDRKRAERQFREIKASMEYDKDWLGKIHQARDRCYQACLQSFFIATVALLVMEAYRYLPRDTSTMKFVAILLGCNCDTASEPSITAKDGWTMTWFSSYCSASLISWTPYNSLLFCHAKCLILQLSPAFCIQVLLRFCQCPRLLHQAVTLVTVVSLFSSQLIVASSYFAWFRLTPLLLTTLLCSLRTWRITKRWVWKLQRSEEEMRKELENALISLDLLRTEIMMHVCFLGLLLATSSAVVSHQ